MGRLTSGLCGWRAWGVTGGAGGRGGVSGIISLCGGGIRRSGGFGWGRELVRELGLGWF